MSASERLLPAGALTLLAANCVFSLVTLARVFLRTQQCYGYWMRVGGCRTLLGSVVAPDRTDFALALLTALLVAFTCLAVSGSVTRQSRLYPPLAAAALAIGATQMNAGIRGPGAVMLTAALLLTAGLLARGAMRRLTVIGQSKTAQPVEDTRHSLGSRVLVVAGVSVLSDAFLTRLAQFHQMPEVHGPWFVWAAALLALGLLTFLLAQSWCARGATGRILGLQCEIRLGRTGLAAGWLGALATVLGFVVPIVALGAILAEPLGLLTGIGKSFVGLLSHASTRVPKSGPLRSPPPDWFHHQLAGPTLPDKGRHHAATAHAVTHATSWFDMLIHVGVWALALVAIGLLIGRWRHAIREGREADLPGVVQFLLALGRRIHRRTRAVGAVVGKRLPARLVDPGRSILPGLSPTGSATERIRAYYLATLTDAARRGLPRQPAQTPLRYHDYLEPHVPGAATPLAALTADFLAARYSPHPPAESSVLATQRNWQLLRTALRRMPISE